MKIKILKIYELNNVLRVEIESKYGIDNFGLSLDSKYLNPVTQKPKYLNEIKTLLENKYKKELAIEKEIDKKQWNKEIDLEKM